MFTRIFQERTPSLALIFTDNEERAKQYIDSITPFLDKMHEIHVPAADLHPQPINPNLINQAGEFLRRVREEAFSQDRLFFVIVTPDIWRWLDLGQNRPTSTMLATAGQADVAIVVLPEAIEILKAKGRVISADKRSAALLEAPKLL